MIRRSIFILGMIVLIAGSGSAQGLLLAFGGSGAPSGPCPTGLVSYRDIASGWYYDCVANAWHLTTAGVVPFARTVNGRPLSSDVVIGPTDIAQDATHRFVTDSEKTTWNAAGGVPSTRLVNSHPLSADVTVTASDVGLGSANNTSDANKPVSAAQQTALNLKANISSLALVATSGAYADLSGKPTIPAAQVQSDWNAISGMGQILNKPTLGGAALLNVGTVIGTVAAGDDSRMANARTPTSHASTHVTGGSDVIASVVAGGNAGLMTGADKTKLDGVSGTNTGDQNLSGLMVKANNLSDLASVATAKVNLALVKGDVGLPLVVNADTTTTVNITDSANKRFVTDAQQVVIGNTSGTNTGDQTSVTGNSGTTTKWATARSLAGNSVDGSANVNFANKFIAQGTVDAGLSAAQFLGALGTGIVKNTTSTGVLSIAVAGDFPTLNQSTTGSAATLTTPRAINGVNFDGSAAITVTAAAGTLTGAALPAGVTGSSLTSIGTLTAGAVPTTLLTGTILNAQLAGSIDLTTKVINVLPFANGGRAGSAATPATTGAQTINMTASVITITPTGAVTFNASGGSVGQIATFAITTAGTTSFVMTWGTNFKSVGTLATGTVAGKIFAVTFVSTTGTQWIEVARTAAQ
jgi:hypothetical protein